LKKRREFAAFNGADRHLIRRGLFPDNFETFSNIFTLASG